MLLSRCVLWSGSVLAVALANLLAAPALDLARITPVPADQPVPIQDFFRPPLWRQPKLSPSGTHIAGLMHVKEDKYQLLIHDLESKKTEILGAFGDKDIYHFTWLDDRRLLFFLSSKKLYGLGLFAVEVGRIKYSYPLLQYAGATLVGIPKDDRLSPLVWLRRDAFDEGRDRGVAVINTGIKTGRFVDLSAASADYSRALNARDDNYKVIRAGYPAPKGDIVYRYLADRDGELAFAFTSTDGNLTMHRLTAERQWVPCPIDLETTDILMAGDNPGEVLACLQENPNSPSVLCYLDAVTGERREVVLADEEYDFTGGLYREPGSRQIVGAMYQRNGPRTVWFDEGFRAIQKSIEGLFSGQVTRIIGNSEKGGRFLVSTYSDRQPATYYWVDLQKRSVNLVKNTAPWIDPARMQPMQILKYKTRDGRQLDAYVTLPKGTSKKKPAPLVVLPHGGPWVRDNWGFDSEVQFLASRGYAVIQPNYRGSPGYDWMFPIEDQWEFRKMHDDVTDATRMLLGTGLIDPTRVAIMGGSFGGYLALSGVVHEPDLYRCAVTMAGIFDWATVLKEEKHDRYEHPSYSRMLKRLGDPKEQAERYDTISPLRHVKNVRVPVLVAHGKEDPVASIAESRRLVAEFEKYKVPHEKFFVRGEGHGMGHLKNRVELYERIEAFLEKHLTPVIASAPAAPAP